jgi:NarL family two-component system sensor histidine kinase YdfH
MNVHIALHWLSARLRTWNWAAIYLVVQISLAFVIVILAGNFGPMLGLYLGLIGEIVGLLREKPRWAAVAVASCLGLSLINFGLLVGWGELYWWLLAVVPMAFFVILYVVMYSRQAEARSRAQALLKDLEAANRQLTEYAAQVEDLTIANERQRMARELHDTLSQGLAGLILQLEAVDAHLAGNRLERARTIVQQTMERARATLADARRAIDDLRRGEPRDLEESIRQEVSRFTDTTGIPCDLDIHLPPNLPEALCEPALRSVAEALTNIAYHAQAHHASVRLATADNSLAIEICDDGQGFDPQTINQLGHYGLLGMRERVRLAGGSLEIESTPGSGTSLKLKFPL